MNKNKFFQVMEYYGYTIYKRREKETLSLSRSHRKRWKFDKTFLKGYE